MNLDPEISASGFLLLAGHPLRWRLLQELARSDRVVQELTDLVGEPQNLVSYHLGKLRDGYLVSAHRSAADGRDTYYTADLVRIGKALSATGRALHEGLDMRRPPPITEIAPRKVLFLCTGNSARSQMAEALVEQRSGGVIHAVSAGSEPKPLHPNAVRAMRELHDIDLSGNKSKHLRVFAKQSFDDVISLCDRVREVCPEFRGAPTVAHWSIPNPATGEPDDVSYPLFQKTAADLATRIDFWLASFRSDASTSRKQKGKS